MLHNITLCYGVVPKLTKTVEQYRQTVADNGERETRHRQTAADDGDREERETAADDGEREERETAAHDVEVNSARTLHELYLKIVCV